MSINVFDVYNIAAEKLKAAGLTPHSIYDINVYSDHKNKLYVVNIPVTKSGARTTVKVWYDEVHGVTKSTSKNECKSIW
jgi:hypothetical protein